MTSPSVPPSYSTAAAPRSLDTLVIAIAAAFVLVADQLVKHWIITNFLPGESRLVIPHLLCWTYEQNIHGAFGLFGSNAVLLIGMALLVLVIFWLLFRDAARSSIVIRIAFGTILGGAISNVLDRVHYGFVIDFIDFYKIWPNVFNLGDTCITLGVLALILAGSMSSRAKAHP